MALIVENENSLSTTNRKPPKNLFNKFFPMQERTIDEQWFCKKLTYTVQKQ